MEADDIDLFADVWRWRGDASDRKSVAMMISKAMSQSMLVALLATPGCVPVPVGAVDGEIVYVHQSLNEQLPVPPGESVALIGRWHTQNMQSSTAPLSAGSDSVKCFADSDDIPILPYKVIAMNDMADLPIYRSKGVNVDWEKLKPVTAARKIKYLAIVDVIKSHSITEMRLLGTTSRTVVDVGVSIYDAGSQERLGTLRVKAEGEVSFSIPTIIVFIEVDHIDETACEKMKQLLYDGFVAG